MPFDVVAPKPVGGEEEDILRFSRRRGAAEPNQEKHPAEASLQRHRTSSKRPLDPQLIGHAVFAFESELHVPRAADGISLLLIAIVEEVPAGEVE